jgi:hypothetical protein
MPNLRRMIDGHGSMQFNIQDIVTDKYWKPQDEFMMRRKVNRSGPSTSEVLVGKILAMHDDGTADVSISKPGGSTQRSTVPVKDLVPVTEAFRRTTIQFSPQYRPRA